MPAINVYNNIITRDYEDTIIPETPENMLRLVRLSMPNLISNRLVQEVPMEPPREEEYIRYYTYYANTADSVNITFEFNTKKRKYRKNCKI